MRKQVSEWGVFHHLNAGLLRYLQPQNTDEFYTSVLFVLLLDDPVMVSVSQQLPIDLPMCEPRPCGVTNTAPHPYLHLKPGAEPRGIGVGVGFGTFLAPDTCEYRI